MKKCKKCGQEKEYKFFNIRKSNRDGRDCYCKTCHSISNKNYRKNNPIKIKEYGENYYLKNKEAILKYGKLWRKNNKLKKNDANKKERLKVKELVFSHYGKICSCKWCNETEESFLQIDHVNNDGYKERKRGLSGYMLYRHIINNNYPDSYQVLCANCNFSKSMNGGVCVHVLREKSNAA